MRIFFIIVVAGAIFSCSGTKETPGLSFETKAFHQESVGGCETDSIPCASFETNYPVFSPARTPMAELLNGKVLRSIYPPDSSATVEEKAKIFIQEFKDGQKENSLTTGWYYKSVVEILLLSDTLVSLRSDEDYFSGGAHGGSATTFINVDPTTGKKFTLRQVLKPGHETDFNKIGERFFREARGLAPQADLEQEGFDFSGDFKLNDNYGFRKEGIIFVFNSYEIGAYALGPTEFMIPYEEIRGLLK